MGSRAGHLSSGTRYALRAASVIGTEQGLTLLAATCGAGEQLAAHLVEAAGAGLLGDVANASEPTYRFRHALVQEAISRGMLRGERRRLHGRVAWALELLSQGRIPEVSAVLARHFTAAGEQGAAVRYFDMAADHALRAYANNEAITLFRSALDIAEQESSRTERVARAALRFRGKLAQVLWRVGRRGEAREVLQDAVCSLGIAEPPKRSSGATTWADGDRRAPVRRGRSRLRRCGKPPRGPSAGKDEATVNLWLEIMINGRAQLYLHQKPGRTHESCFGRPSISRGSRDRISEAHLLPLPCMAASTGAAVAGRRGGHILGTHGAGHGKYGRRRVRHVKGKRAHRDRPFYFASAPDAFDLALGHINCLSCPLPRVVVTQAGRPGRSRV